MHRTNPAPAGCRPRPKRVVVTRAHAGLVGAVLAALALLIASRPAAAAGLARAASGVGDDLLSWWQAAVLGVVEGLTEYLPVSSTGHLLVTARLLGLPDEKGSDGLDAVNTYVIAIQFGAIVAVAGLFWRRFVAMLAGLAGRNPAGRDLLVNLVIAFVPAALLGFLFDDPIEELLFGPWPVVVTWVLGGLLILWLERTGRIPDRGVPGAEPGVDPLTSITRRQALVIGLAQCAALVPGTSRSLATILGALLVGVAMTAAVEFSFLLGFATLSAATAYKLASDGGNLVDQFGVADPLIGALFAFGSAVLAIKWLITYLERHDLSIFAWYRFVVAGLAVLLLVGGVI
ncbi:MAG TPA: undecaprenyl-diphosphate phosphatase [Acidimicrobiales bacterium]|nr:undecaprenyl-diphosphate phosphatase [Acidimicrobiales bacterium]